MAGVVFEFPGNIVFDMIWCLELNCPWDIEEIGMDHLTGNLVSELAWCVCARFENVGKFNLLQSISNNRTKTKFQALDIIRVFALSYSAIQLENQVFA